MIPPARVLRLVSRGDSGNDTAPEEEEEEPEFLSNPPDTRRVRVNRFIEGHRFHPRPFDREGCSFRYSYYARPWDLALDLFRWCRAFWNRGWYGWDSSDTWELDHTLTRLLPQMLRHLNHIKQSTPMIFMEDTDNEDSTDEGQTGEARYTAWLEDVASAFDAYGMLRDAGPFGHLYTPEWEAAHPYDRADLLTPVTDAEGNVRLNAKGKPIGYTLNLPSPLDDLSDEQCADLRRRHGTKVAAVKARMKTLFDYIETLWD